MTDEELKGTLPDIPSALEIITTLRAQLAEAQKERNAVVATLVEVSRWWAKEEARADRAELRVATLEAALAEAREERDDYAHKLMQANNTYTEMHLEIERLRDKLTAKG